MAAVSAAQPQLQMRNVDGMKRGEGLVKTGEVIYLHTLVARQTNGKLIKAVSSTTTAVIVGIALSSADMDGTDKITGDGTLRCEYGYMMEALLPLTTATTVGITGSAVYATDNFTVQGTSPTGYPQVGTLEQWEAANSGWVLIRGSAMART